MKLGTIQGEVNTSSFQFRAVEEVRKFDFVSVKSNGHWILAQVEEVTKHPDGETVANANIIGYRDKGLTKAPRRVIEPDSIVYSADQELISDTLGLKDEGLTIGNLETNEDIDIKVNAEEFYKHFAVLAQTGAGKSYLTGVLIEELLENEYPVLVIDPHGEYSSLSETNPDSDDPSSYDVVEYSPNTDINQHALPLSFSSVNMEKKELLDIIPDSLTNSQMGVMYNALKRLREKDEDYTLKDLMEAVSHEDSTAKWNLLNSLEQLDESGLFTEDPIDLEELLEPGRATVVNLRAVEPETAEMTMYSLAKRLFDLRKKNRIPPFLMVIEEAHNFVPEKGFEQALSNKILRKIASEGRKFGLGLGVVSQRPARIDKNVLSQCNTQFILRITNPNDLKAISKSFEGVTSEVESMIKSLPPGVAFVLGNEYPVMTDVRTRRSKHGGTTQTSDSYVEKEKIEMFTPRKSRKQLEQETGEKYEEAYYPLYLLENDEKKVLIDGAKGVVKAERATLSGLESKVLERLESGQSKSEMLDEIDANLSKLTSVIESLRKKGWIKPDSLETEDSVLDMDVIQERVDREKLIDFEVSETDARSHLEDCSLKPVYYPYYSRGEQVYDPILQKEVS
ncbi:MAG: ATP-binding protein [Candidatus Nanosalina sp.]